MVAALASVAIILAAVVAGIWSGGDTTQVRTSTRPAPTVGGVDTAAYFNVEARTPTAFPKTRLGLGFLALDQPLQRAVVTLGPAATTEPDIFGTARTWTLPAGGALTVSAADDTQEINGLYASVPPGSPARLGAFGGIVLAQSTLRHVVTAWGVGFAAATSPLDDYVVSYVECVGSYPVVVKFDQAAATEGRFAPGAHSPLWDAAVTSLRIAYADEPAGSAGCQK